MICETYEAVVRLPPRPQSERIPDRRSNVARLALGAEGARRDQSTAWSGWRIAEPMSYKQRTHAFLRLPDRSRGGRERGWCLRYP